MGLAGFLDPPREDATRALKIARRAGIRVVMVTGDYPTTAKSIAEMMGFEEGLVLTGSDLERLSDRELDEILDRIVIFARVAPEQKLRIVEAYKRRGYIVAVTGDGVNDAPALKRADVGVAMGSGTEVAKEASDVILLDDNFATIVAAIEEGRRIFDNIRKFSSYLLAANSGEVLAITGAILSKMPLPMLPAHLLWIKVVTDGLPAMALSVDPPSPDVMVRKPRGRKEGVITPQIKRMILTTGLVIALLTLAAFSFARSTSLERGYALAVTTIVLLEFAVIDIIKRVLYHQSVFDSRALVLAIALSILLQLLVIYSPIRSLFRFAILGAEDLAMLALLLAIGYLMIYGYSMIEERKIEHHHLF